MEITQSIGDSINTFDLQGLFNCSLMDNEAAGCLSKHPVFLQQLGLSESIYVARY